MRHGCHNMTGRGVQPTGSADISEGACQYSLLCVSTTSSVYVLTSRSSQNHLCFDAKSCGSLVASAGVRTQKWQSYIANVSVTFTGLDNNNNTAYIQSLSTVIFSSICYGVELKLSKNC